MSGTRARRAAKDSGVPADSGDRADSAGVDGPAVPVHEDIGALTQERDFLLRSIADLDAQHDKGEVTDSDYVELSDHYTARAAQVIRLIESGGVAPGSDARRGAQRGVTTLRSHMPTIITVVVVLVVGGVAGLMVARSSGSTAPPETAMTAGTATSGASTDQDTGPVAELLREASEQTALIQTSLAAGDSEAAVDAYKAAITAYDEVLRIEPDNAEALTYRGWLMHNLATQSPEDMAADLDAEALDWLNRAVTADPGYPDARIFRAILLDAAGRPDEALSDLEAVDTASLPDTMRQMVEQRRASIEAQLGGR